MRVNDPGCRRFPLVCGEIACSQDSNSLVCQFPPNHDGPHDWAPPAGYKGNPPIPASDLDLDARIAAIAKHCEMTIEEARLSWAEFLRTVTMESAPAGKRALEDSLTGAQKLSGEQE